MTAWLLWQITADQQLGGGGFHHLLLKLFPSSTYIHAHWCELYLIKSWSNLKRFVFLKLLLPPLVFLLVNTTSSDVGCWYFATQAPLWRHRPRWRWSKCDDVDSRFSYVLFWFLRRILPPNLHRRIWSIRIGEHCNSGVIRAFNKASLGERWEYLRFSWLWSVRSILVVCRFCFIAKTAENVGYVASVCT